MGHVFVCYSRDDAATVDALAARLGDACRLWIDRRDIQVGQDWSEAINDAIKASDFVLVVLSPGFAASPEARRELDLALRENRVILPVCVARVDLPADLREALGHLHWVDFKPDYERCVQELLPALHGTHNATAALGEDASTGRKLHRDREDLVRFLGLDPVAPQIRIAVGRRELRRMELRDKPSVIPYETDVVADGDVKAAFEINKMLYPIYTSSREFPYEPDLLFVDVREVSCFDRHALILIGGPIANREVGLMLRSHPHVSCRRDEGPAGERLFICCEGPGFDYQYHIHPATRGRGKEQVELDTSFGCVVKRNEPTGPTRFAVWGLDERGSIRAAHWLAHHWKDFVEEGDFTAVLSFPPGAHDAEKPTRLREEIPLWIPREQLGCKVCTSTRTPSRAGADALDLPEA